MLVAVVRTSSYDEKSLSGHVRLVQNAAISFYFGNVEQFSKRETFKLAAIFLWSGGHYTMHWCTAVDSAGLQWIPPVRAGERLTVIVFNCSLLCCNLSSIVPSK